MSVEINATAERIYKDWLNSEGHSEMTGGEAECSPETDTVFSAWDGYISGKNVELIENSKIVQKWRTVEFPESVQDSHLEISLKNIEGGKCKITLIQTDLQIGDGKKYQDGWTAHYFEPMQEHYS